MKKIKIRGIIGMSESATPSYLEQALNEANGDDIEVMFSSPGGFVFPGIEMYNMIRDYKGKKTAILTGLAASMSSYLPMAFDSVEAEDNAVLMIHNPMSGIFNADYKDAEKFAKYMKALRDMLSAAYVGKTGINSDKMHQLMDDETYLFGSEIVANGFADKIKESGKKDKDKEKAILMAKAELDDCIMQIKDSGKAADDYTRAAAMLGSTEQPEMDGTPFDPEMPYPNEHACRVRQPGEFQAGSFRRISQKSDGKTLDIIIGKLKGKTTTTTQAYRYPKNEWTADQARNHCTGHKGLSFEPAKSELPTNPAAAGNNNKEAAKMKNLKELLAENPEAKAEFDKAVSEAQAAGARAGEEKMQAAFAAAIPILSSANYPDSVKERVTAKATAGDIDGLKDFVALHDMTVESMKQKSAAAGQPGETPPAKPEGLSEDGSVENAAQLAAAAASFKKNYGIGEAK